ncbi:hypothetical protein R2R35_08280 [Anaerocolumna sp. AGMB13020]|uniref:hypothetical protein n=1 Tax=Anaerocolumna sp. AGMB13020 TaxID=3081750 RepID=UPI0029538CCA|nr:hypothetical protein [Anaerocolumna sp. AGMB13020]WOO38489.1 hypothetical protein R2R35_08280 [Anaerocolumna sp. AGMB13020]
MKESNKSKGYHKEILSFFYLWKYGRRKRVIAFQGCNRTEKSREEILINKSFIKVWIE